MPVALVWDLETVGTDEAMAAPYPKDERHPPANYSKPEAIAAWHEKDEAKWRGERAKECALSPRLGRIVCVGAGETVLDVAAACAPLESDERTLIEGLWAAIAECDGQIITWNGLGFDIDFLLKRSLILGVKPSVNTRNWTRRYSFDSHYDIRAVLNNWDMRTSGTLTDWCSALGIEVQDETSGADVYEMFKAGNFDGIAAHAKADVSKTRQLYERVSLIYGGLETGKWRAAA